MAKRKEKVVSTETYSLGKAGGGGEGGGAAERRYQVFIRFARTVDIVVSRVGGENLPSQTPFTPSAVYATLLLGLLVKYSLGQGEPLGLIGLGIGEAYLGSQHGGEAPESLVIVTHRGGPVSGHVVAGRAGLM